MKILVLVVLLVGCYESREMATQKQTIVRPSGVVTQPNELGELPPGTLALGDGVMMRKQGVLAPRPAFETYTATPGSFPGADRTVKAFPFEEDSFLAVIRNNNGASESLYVLDGATAGTVGYAGPPTFSFSPGKTFATRVRDRSIITNDYAPAVIDPQAGPNYTARQAGLPMPTFIDFELASGSDAGDVISASMFVGYRAVFRHEASDGYTFRGAVSSSFAYENDTVVSKIPELTVYWDSESPVAAGDILELYRTEQVDDFDLIGDRVRLAFAYTLISTDVTNGFVTLQDTASQGVLGADLYTNESQDGASKSNWMPPPSSDVFTFKGATFYVTTEAWHSLSITIPYDWGLLTTTADIDHGIGQKILAATYTGTTMTVASNTGIKVGMEVTGIDVLAGTYITAISGSGPYTLTLSASVVFPGADDIMFHDVIYIDGAPVNAGTPEVFLSALGVLNAAGTTAVTGLPSEIVGASALTGNMNVVLALPVPGGAAFTVAATNGDRYSPPLPDFGSTPQNSSSDPRTNRVHFSKIDQPEAVPPDQYLLVGKGTIYKLFAGQEALFVFCSDGIFRIDGDGDDWSVSPFDPDTILLSPDAIDSDDNAIYALTTSGLVSVSDAAGVQKISSPLIGDQIRALWKQFQNDADVVLPYTWGVQLACDKYRNEVWLNFNDYGGDGQVQTWIWNVDTNTFFSQSAEETILLAYMPYLQSIITDRASVGSSTIRLTDDSTYMPVDLEFNSIYGADVGVLKQWIDISLLFESWSGGSILPKFSSVEYDSNYSISASTTPFEHVIVPLQDYVYNKQIRFGFLTESEGGGPNWQLKGLTLRYRDASETFRQ